MGSVVGASVSWVGGVGVGVVLGVVLSTGVVSTGPVVPVGGTVSPGFVSGGCVCYDGKGDMSVPLVSLGSGLLVSLVPGKVVPFSL